MGLLFSCFTLFNNLFCQPDHVFMCVLCVYILYVHLYGRSVYIFMCVYVFKRMEIMTSSWDFRICPVSHSQSPPHPPPSFCLPVSLFHCICFFSQIQYLLKHTPIHLLSVVEEPFHSDS